MNKPDTQCKTKCRRKCVAYCLRQITWTIIREWTSIHCFQGRRASFPFYFSSLKSEWIINVMAYCCWMKRQSANERSLCFRFFFLLFSHSNGGENVRIILSAVLLIPIKLSSDLWVKWCSTVLFFSFCLIETWDWNEWKAISQKSRFDHHFFLTFSECFLRFCNAVWERLRWSDCTRILFFFPLLVGLSPQWKKKTYNLQSISATDYTRSKDRGKEREKKRLGFFFDWWS